MVGPSWQVLALGGPVENVGQSSRSWPERHGLFLRFTGSTGKIGCGEASPLPGVSPESLESVKAATQRLPQRVIASWEDYDNALAELPQELPSLRFGAASALLEEWAARQQCSVAALLARSAPGRALLEGEGLSTTVNVAGLLLGEPPELWQQLQGHRAQGVHTFKRKVAKGDWTAELAVVRELAAQLQAGERLRLDANRGFSDAANQLRDLASLDIEYIEEPAPFEQLVQLTTSPLPIALDESLRDAPEAPLRLAHLPITAWVLKPALHGDPLNTLRLAQQARDSGCVPVLSHLFDGPVARALYLALARLLPGTAHGLAEHAALAALSPPLAKAGDALDILASSGNRAGQLAFVGSNASTTFSEAAEHVRVLAARLLLSPTPLDAGAWFRQGVEAIDGVAVVVARPDFETAVTLWTLASLGVPFVLVDARWPAQLRAQRLAGIGVAAVFDGNEVTQTQPLAAGRGLDAPAALVFTSGSTAQPKLRVLSRGNMIAAAIGSNQRLEIDAHDRWCWALSPAHVGGLSVWARCLVAGASLAEGRPERLFEGVRATSATVVSAVPAQLAREDLSRAPPSLRTVLLGGAAAPWPLVKKARTLGLRVFRSYGATESSAMAVCESVADATRLDGPKISAGTALAGVSVDCSYGVVTLAGSTLASSLPGGQPEFWRSEDLGDFDEEGNLRVLGRRDHVIVSGGANVSPELVECVLETVEGVAQACVFGLDDVTWGQVVVALLVGEAIGQVAQPAVEDAVVEAGRAQLPPEAIPRALRWVDALPHTPSGKLDRRRAAALWRPK